MQFKNDKYLEVLCSASRKSAAFVGKSLCAAFINIGMLEDTEFVYGTNVLLAMGPQYMVDVKRIICETLGLSILTDDVFKAFCRLTVMGDYECPHCGGSLSLYDEETREIQSWRNELPPTYKTIRETYRCNVCGEKIIREYD